MLEDILKTKSDFAITDNTLIFRFREWASSAAWFIERV